MSKYYVQHAKNKINCHTFAGTVRGLGKMPLVRNYVETKIASLMIL